MGILFTLIYICTAYLSPELAFGNLALDHIQVYIALVALIFSIVQLPNARLLEMPQTYAIFGLSFSVAMSLIFSGWLGGAPVALMEFLPNAVVFILIVVNFRKKIHLQILVAILFSVAASVIVHAVLALRTGDENSPYLLSQHIGTGVALFRIRGLSFLNDPNDLAQFLVGLIPCMFLFWRKDNGLRNAVLVVLPVGVLVLGMYLTHSRGGMVALLAAAVVACRRKIGVVKAIVLGILLFIGFTAMGWSGGRSDSDSAGRTDAWGAGLSLVGSHPIFGVGYRMFTDHYEITAHNSIVVCAAELGLVGLISWLLLVVPTVRDAYTGSMQEGEQNVAERGRGWAARRARDGLPAATHSPPPASAPAYSKVMLAGAGANGAVLRRPAFGSTPSPGMPAHKLVDPGHVYAPFSERFPDSMEETDGLSDAEVRRMSGLGLISMVGFLTAGWFLSRSYTMTLFVTAGIATSIYRMAWSHGTAPPPWPLSKAVRMSAMTAAILIAAIYIFLRIDHLL